MFFQLKAAAAALCFFAVSAQASEAEGIHKFWIDKTFENTSKVRNYQAAVQQSSNQSATPVLTRVQFQSPFDFYMQIEQPASLQGLTYRYQQRELLLYAPAQNYALKITGLGPTASDKKMVADMYWANQDYYRQTFTPSIEVARRISVGVDLDAKDDELEIHKSQLFIDYDYSLLMKGDFYFRDGSRLSLSHDQIEFNNDDFLLPQPSVPNEVQLRSWNLTRSPLTVEQLAGKTSLRPRWPQLELERWGMAQPQFYLSDQGPGGVAAHYANEHYFLLLTANSDDANSPASHSPGTTIQLDNGVQGQLLQSPVINSIQLRLQGINYQLFSNIHLEDLLRVARTLSN